jgi:hypothetical protein
LTGFADTRAAAFDHGHGQRRRDFGCQIDVMVPGGGTKPLIKLVFLYTSIHLYPLVKRLPLPKYALPCPATPSRKRWTIRWMENAGNESAIGSGHQDGNCWQAL